jgi:biopolymer transport protein TolQ
MSLGNLFRDPVLAILAAASLVSWAIMLQCVMALRRAARDDDAFRHGRSSPSAPLAHLRSELSRYSGTDREHLLTIMDGAIAQERHRLDRHLPLLGVIGSTSPYLGLFGTVIGIIQAFQAIQAQNNMSPSVVAGGIALALVATAMGLAVAIPAVAAHHLIAAAFSRRVSIWESVVADWIAEESSKEARHESVTPA